MSDTKKCPNCEKDISAIALKCEFCGKSLLDDSDTGELATNLYWDGLGGQTKLSDTPRNIETDPLELTKSIFSAKYDIIEEVGRGGMAVVYRAMQKNLNREVALKVLPQQFVHDEEYIIRFHREAREVAKMNHPNIVTIFDEGEIDGYHYLAMEFLAGQDLHDILKEKKTLSLEEVNNIMSPMAEALDYVHSKGLVHRDIKSSNIFVLKNGRSVLTDFGIAKTAGKTKLTQVGSIIGTPEYMSPEQADSLEVDGRGDLYSLAVVMYEALTGSVTFKADNPITLIRKIIDEKPVNPRKLNPSIPKWMDEIIMKCLEKAPKDRIQSGHHLAQSIKEKKVIIGEPTKQDVTASFSLDSNKTQKISAEQLSSMESSTQTAGKDKNTGKGLMISVAAVLAVIVIGAGYYFGIYAPSQESAATNTISNTPAQQIETTTTDNNKTVIPVADSSDQSSPETHEPDLAETEKPVEKVKDDKPTGPTQQEIDQAAQLRLKRKLVETKLAQAELEAKDAKRKFEHAEKMRNRNLITPSDFNKAKDAYEKSLQEVRKYQQQLANLR
ncbi:MAG: protein kinase [Bacteroidetes bacterium]|nr:protein kinase [Bacteroidota bacterium]